MVPGKDVQGPGHDGGLKPRASGSSSSESAACLGLRGGLDDCSYLGGDKLGSQRRRGRFIFFLHRRSFGCSEGARGAAKQVGHPQCAPVRALAFRTALEPRDTAVGRTPQQTAPNPWAPSDTTSGYLESKIDWRSPSPRPSSRHSSASVLPGPRLRPRTRPRPPILPSFHPEEH